MKNIKKLKIVTAVKKAVKAMRRTMTRILAPTYPYNDIPVNICCPSIVKAWDNDIIGFFKYTNGNTLMTWNSNSFYSQKSSSKCIFCDKKLVSTRLSKTIRPSNANQDNQNNV